MNATGSPPLRCLGSLALLLVLVGCTPAPAPPAMHSAGGWLEFSGSWTAAGTRRILPLGEGRQAVLLDIKGSLLLSGASRPATGFRADAVMLNDTLTGMAGRAAWTDERGDQVFSELASVAPGSLAIAGVIVGGTGRYAGATGDYSFTWSDVIATEDGTVHGHAIDLKGRVRRAGDGGAS